MILKSEVMNDWIRPYIWISGRTAHPDTPPEEQPTQLTPSEEEPTQLTPSEEQPTQLTPLEEQPTRLKMCQPSWSTSYPNQGML